MFPIYRATELAHHLGTTVARLKDILYSANQYYDELTLIDPRKPDKERTVLSVNEPLRQWQSRFYRDVLLKSLKPSQFSHGGRHGFSIKTNAEAHLASRFIYKTDISNFYPSVHDRRVYRLFKLHFGCSPDVSNLCSRLCTHKHHLALGLATSPIIADQLLRPVDCRIAGACRRAGWVYTRYVDDITISGPNDMSQAGITNLISKILSEHGFHAKKSKSECGDNGSITITGVRVVDGHLDVGKEYIRDLNHQLSNALSLSHDGDFVGPYYTYGQLAGRVRFVCWVNPRRAAVLKRKLSRLSARRMSQHALERGLVKCKKRLRRPV